MEVQEATVSHVFTQSTKNHRAQLRGKGVVCTRGTCILGCQSGHILTNVHSQNTTLSSQSRLKLPRGPPAINRTTGCLYMPCDHPFGRCVVANIPAIFLLQQNHRCIIARLFCKSRSQRSKREAARAARASHVKTHSRISRS